MTMLPFTRRGIYLIDAVGCFALGVVGVAFAAPLAAVLGPALPAAAVIGLGAFLVAYALFNLTIGLRRDFPQGHAVVNVLGDALWVVGSLALIVAGGADLTAVGMVVVAVLALGVAAIGLVKYMGLRAAPRLA